MTAYLTVRDLIEKLEPLDQDARVELEVWYFNKGNDHAEQWTETEPLADLQVHCSGKRYVTLRGPGL